MMCGRGHEVVDRRRRGHLEFGRIEGFVFLLHKLC
jgi:hypothetical protein